MKMLWNTHCIKKIKNNLFPSLSADGINVVDCYLRIMLFLYPLFVSGEYLFYVFTSKAFLYLLLTLLSVLLYLFSLSRKFVRYRSRFRQEDLLLLFIALLLVGKIIVRIVQRDPYYENDIFLVCLIGTYFLTGSLLVQGCGYYLKLILFASLFWDIELLGYYLLGVEGFLGGKAMLQQPEAFASWLLLTICISTVLYCIERQKQWEWFFLGISATEFFVIFFYNDMTVICLTGMILLVIPLVFEPTVTLIRKNLILCFCFLFILSNIPLISAMVDGGFDRWNDLRYCIYLDILLSIAGIFVSTYWKKVPKDRDPELVLMKKFRYWYMWILTAAVIILFFCLLSGDRMNGLPERLGKVTLEAFSILLLRSIDSNTSFFQMLLENYGIIGYGLWSILLLSFMRMIYIKWRKANMIIKVYLFISSLFLLQSFFYKFQPISTPLYIIIMTLALFTNGKKREILNNFLETSVIDEENGKE